MAGAVLVTELFWIRRTFAFFGSGMRQTGLAGWPSLPLLWYISGGVFVFVSVSFFLARRTSGSRWVWRFIRIFFEGVSVIDLSAVGFSISILYWSFLVGWVDACMDVLVCIVMDEISGSFLLFLVRSYDLAC